MSSVRPFFSVIIPTKNRPELLRDAIQSVLRQDFDDFECIVSDNFNDDQTQCVIREFSKNPRFRCVRTEGELNMPDHWEFAESRAVGKYVVMISDRSLLCRGALSRLHGIMSNPEFSGIQLFTWQHAIYEIGKGWLRYVFQPDHKNTVLSSENLIREVAATQRVDWRYPIILNSCYQREAGTVIRQKLGRLFFPISPDVTGGFALLSHIPRLLAIGEIFFIMQTATNSTGHVRNARGPEFYLETLNVPTWYRYAPIQAPFPHSLWVDDLIFVREKSGHSIIDTINWSEYFRRCYEEFVYFSTNGFVKNRKKEFWNAWQSALLSFGDDVQSAVKRKMLRAKIAFTLKALLAKSRFASILRGIQGLVQYHVWHQRCASALAAAGFSDA